MYSMVKPLLEQLRAKVENAHGLTDITKSDILKLVADLARQTAGNAAIHPAAAKHGGAQLKDLVEKLEISHPDITSLANRIATMLGNVGI